MFSTTDFKIELEDAAVEFWTGYNYQKEVEWCGQYDDCDCDDCDKHYNCKQFGCEMDEDEEWCDACFDEE